MVLAPRHFESAFWNLDCNLDLALSHRGHANPRKRTSQERNLPDGLWCVYIGHVLTLNFRLCSAYHGTGNIRTEKLAGDEQ